MKEMFIRSVLVTAALPEPNTELGFVTILDNKDVVVSNPGGTKPEYKNGALQLSFKTNPFLIIVMMFV
jgi:hypothetical protein